jgi:hypothetical protein
MFKRNKNSNSFIKLEKNFKPTYFIRVPEYILRVQRYILRYIEFVDYKLRFKLTVGNIELTFSASASTRIVCINTKLATVSHYYLPPLTIQLA